LIQDPLLPFLKKETKGSFFQIKNALVALKFRRRWTNSSLSRIAGGTFAAG
jgi:hypothetical protein